MKRVSILLGVLLLVTAVACPIPTRKKPDRTRGPEAADVVVLTLHGRLTEQGDEGQPFGGNAASLRKLLRRLRQARTSKKVDKIVLRIGGLQTGWAQLEELRHAVSLARQAGKRVIAHLDDAGNAEYFLATAADEIVMSESSSLWLVGVAAQVLFVKGLLEKVGVQAEFLHEGKYKSAADMFTRDAMSPEMKEALGALLDDTLQTLVQAVATRRKLKPAQVRKLVDGSPHAAEACKKLGLVDRIANHRNHTRQLAGTGSINWEYGKKKKETGTLRSLMELLKPSEMVKPPKTPHLALVYAEGPIIHGPPRKGFGTDNHISSFRLVRVLDELHDKPLVKAVVLRINSGGGSALASDLIWHSVKRLATKKPVVVSMGDVAASGGYYIATPATRIYAQPATITGSIGVIGGKFSLQGLFQKIGVTTGRLTRGARADLFTLARPWTAEERQLIQRYMSRTYRLFKQRVSSTRKLPPAAVERVAQGRVWSGRAAEKHKLVDRLGGLLDAVADAKTLGKLPTTAKTAIYPRPKTWIEKLQEGLGVNDTRVQLLARLLLDLGRGPETGQLRRLLMALPAWQRDRALTWMPYLVTVR